jgi:uncharacterized protein (DUF2164 family)
MEQLQLDEDTMQRLASYIAAYIEQEQHYGVTEIDSSMIYFAIDAFMGGASEGWDD